MLISLFHIYLLIFVDIFHLHFPYSFVILRISYVNNTYLDLTCLLKLRVSVL